MVCRAVVKQLVVLAVLGALVEDVAVQAEQVVPVDMPEEAACPVVVELVVVLVEQLVVLATVAIVQQPQLK